MIVGLPPKPAQRLRLWTPPKGRAPLESHLVRIWLTLAQRRETEKRVSRLLCEKTEIFAVFIAF